MANNFRFDDNQDDAEYNDNGSQGSYIIQCPSCHARFVLQEEDLAGIEDPRFHCPRCDTLFDAVDANLKEVQYSEPVTQGQEEGDYQQSYEDENYDDDNEEPNENSSVDYDAYEVSENVQYYSDNDEENYQLENNNAQVSTDDSFDPFEDLDTPENKFEYKPLSEIKYNQNTDEQNSNYNESFEKQSSSTNNSNKTIRDFFDSRSDTNKITKNSSSRFTLGNDTLNRNETSTIMSDSYSDASYSHVVNQDPEKRENRASSWLTSWKRKDENKVGVNDTKSESTETESFLYSSPINENNSEKKKNEDSSEQYSFKFSNSKAETNKSSNAFSVNTSDYEITVGDSERNSSERLYREPTPTKTFTKQDLQNEKSSTIPAFYIYIFLPFIATIIALGTITFKLVNSDQQNLIRAFLPSAPTAAPSDLIITELNFKQFPLQSGEILHLISGTIANHTNQSFDNIVLEGLAFDVTGQPLFSKRVNADAALTLAKADVKSFTSEMINDKQDEIPSRRYELASNASQQFAIGIVDDEMRNAKFFSARIYMAE